MKKHTSALKPQKNDDANIRQQWREAGLDPLWERKDSRGDPELRNRPNVWEWSTVRPLIQEAIEVVSPADVERRVLSFNSPAWQVTGDMYDRSAIPTISTALQILMPGESARPHRHSMGALRFVLEGNGAITTTDGKACQMEEGDLVLTPSWRWHEHYHGGTEPIIWMDVLDSPLHRYLGTDEFEPGPTGRLPDLLEDEVFSTPGIVPEVGMEASQHSLLFRYPFEDVLNALKAAPQAADGSRKVRYVNPVTGGSVLEMLDCYMVQLEPGQATSPFITNSNCVCNVVSGSGTTQLGKHTVNWQEKDIFTLPQNNSIIHASDEGAMIFVVSDRQIYKKLGLLKEAVLNNKQIGE